MDAKVFLGASGPVKETSGVGLAIIANIASVPVTIADLYALCVFQLVYEACNHARSPPSKLKKKVH